MFIESISKGCFVGAGLPITQYFDVMASRFVGAPTAALMFNGAPADAPPPEVLVVRPAPATGYPGQLRLTLQPMTMGVGTYVVELTDANGTAPGFQIFLGRL